MKKPRRIFYTKELPANYELDLSAAKTITDKELAQLLKKAANGIRPKKASWKRPPKRNFHLNFQVVLQYAWRNTFRASFVNHF